MSVDPARLRRLLEEGTPGKWEFDANEEFAELPNGEYLGNPFPSSRYNASADIALIVAMHEALPQLLERLETWDLLLRYIREALDSDGKRPSREPFLCWRIDQALLGSPVGAD